MFCILWSTIGTSTSRDNNYINYFNLTSKAKYYININKNDSAIIYFNKAFSIVNKRISFDEFLLARCYALVKIPNKSFYWLSKCIKNGMVYNYHKEIRNDSSFNILNEKQKLKIVELDSKMLAFYENNPKIKNIRDSIFYYFYNDSYYMGGTNKLNSIKYGRKYIDTSLVSYMQFQNKFVNYIIKNGYPGLKVNSSDVISIPLWHLSVENKVRLKPYLMIELLNGNITPDDFAGFDEKLEYEKNFENCTYYFLIKSCDSSQWEKIIYNRKQIGMSIYLENGDYSFFSYINRSTLPWIK